MIKVKQCQRRLGRGRSRPQQSFRRTVFVLLDSHDPQRLGDTVHACREIPPQCRPDLCNVLHGIPHGVHFGRIVQHGVDTLQIVVFQGALKGIAGCGTHPQPAPEGSRPALEPRRQTMEVLFQAVILLLVRMRGQKGLQFVQISAVRAGVGAADREPVDQIIITVWELFAVLVPKGLELRPLVGLPI